MRRQRVLAVHVTAQVIEYREDLQPEGIVVDRRTFTEVSADVEQLRERTHDRIDATVYGLADRMPLLPRPYDP